MGLPPILSTLDATAMLLDLLVWFGIAVGVIGVIGVCLAALLPMDWL